MLVLHFILKVWEGTGIWKWKLYGIFFFKILLKCTSFSIKNSDFMSLSSLSKALKKIWKYPVRWYEDQLIFLYKVSLTLLRLFRILVFTLAWLKYNFWVFSCILCCQISFKCSVADCNTYMVKYTASPLWKHYLSCINW